MKVLVAPLIMPGMLMKAHWALLEIVQKGWPLVRTDALRTEMRRNRIAEHLLTTQDADAVVMLDGDHKHPGDVVHKLLHDAEQMPEADVIGALCYRRSAPYDPCAWMLDHHSGKYYWSVPWPEGLVEVDAVGFGAVLFRRRCFEILPPPWFIYDYQYVIREDTWPTEDVTFCKEARKAGLRIFVDTTLESPHLFEGEITRETCLSYLAANPNAVKEYNNASN